MKSPPFLAEWVACECPKCSHMIRASMRHYDELKCACDALLWALRPVKGGPLVLVEHPGYAHQGERGLFEVRY